MHDEYEDYFEEEEERPPDPQEERAISVVRAYIESRQEVFFSRQLEVTFENDFFH